MICYRLHFPDYPLREFERQLALRELKMLAATTELTVDQCSVTLKVPNKLDESALSRLTFFHIIERLDQETQCVIKPTQITIESTSKLAKLGGNRQEIEQYTHQSDVPRIARREHTYLTHTLHQYKGKFYPQIAKSLMGIACVKPGQTVLDIFGGSGTTVLECWLNNVIGISVDLNPLACLIARVKIECLTIPPEELETSCDRLNNGIARDTEKYGLTDDLLGNGSTAASSDRTWLQLASKVPYIEYMQRWFNRTAIAKLAIILTNIQGIKDRRIREFCLLAVSDIVREFSFQDPGDLRVRRRKDSPPTHRLLERFARTLAKNCRAVYAFGAVQSKLEISDVPTYIHQGDVRWLHCLSNRLLDQPRHIDAVITSPPYATALPYIETDRLSLYLLNLMKPTTRRSIEWNMIGNREINVRARKALESDLLSDNTTCSLPRSVKELLLQIHHLNNQGGVGFRRRNMSSLLYKYFADMRSAFTQTRRVLKPGGMLAVVIGNNHTYAGGERIEIPTDRLLMDLAQELGFEEVCVLPMTDQPAYMAHSKNMVRSETIFVVRKPADAPEEWDLVADRSLEVPPPLR